jgi:hypothetical protein
VLERLITSDFEKVQNEDVLVYFKLYNPVIFLRGLIRTTTYYQDSRYTAQDTITAYRSEALPPGLSASMSLLKMGAESSYETLPRTPYVRNYIESVTPQKFAILYPALTAKLRPDLSK